MQEDQERGGPRQQGGNHRDRDPGLAARRPGPLPLQPGLQLAREGGHRRVPQVPVALHGLTDDRDQGLRHVDQGRRLLRQHLGRDLVHPAAREGRLSGKEMIEGRAQRVEVRADVQRIAPDLLGARVLRGAGHGPARRHGVVQDREAEVRQHHAAPGLDQDVAGLDVPMDHARLVGVDQGPRDLQRQPGRLAGRERRLRGRSVHEGHHQVRAAVLHPPLEDRDDGGVRELAGHPAFPLDPLRRMADLALEVLDGDPAPERAVPGLPDFRHAARAKERDEDVVPQDPVGDAQPGDHLGGNGGSPQALHFFRLQVAAPDEDLVQGTAGAVLLGHALLELLGADEPLGDGAVGDGSSGRGGEEAGEALEGSGIDFHRHPLNS